MTNSVTVKIKSIDKLRNDLESILLSKVDAKSLGFRNNKNIIDLLKTINGTNRKSFKVDKDKDKYEFERLRKILFDKDYVFSDNEITCYCGDERFDIPLSYVDIEFVKKSIDKLLNITAPQKYVKLAKAFNEKFEGLAYRVITGGTTETISVKEIEFHHYHSNWVVDTRMHRFTFEQIEKLLNGDRLGWSEQITDFTSFRFEDVRGVTKGFPLPASSTVKW